MRTLTIAALTLFAAVAFAQPRMYDPKSVVTITGEITAIQTFSPRPGMGPGLHAQVKTAKGVMDVHLGPAWYLEKQTHKLVVGDKVTITGSQITFEGKPAVIAAEVNRNGTTILKLRDPKTGVPVWRGQGRGRGGPK